jgi:hypothetical protein
MPPEAPTLARPATPVLRTTSPERDARAGGPCLADPGFFSVSDGILGAGFRPARIIESGGLIDRHFRLAAPPPTRPQVKTVRLAFGLGPVIMAHGERFDCGVRLNRIGDRLGGCPDGRGYEGRQALGRGVFRRPRLDALIARSVAAKIPRAAPVIARAAIVLIASLKLIPRALIS